MSFPLSVRALGADGPLTAGRDDPRVGPRPTGPEIVEIAQAAGLRGRGGAGFPLAVKLRSVASAAAPRYVIANAEEGEPTSAKDRYLIRERPRRVLAGLALAARAVGAERTYVYVADRVGAARLRGVGDEGVEIVRVEPGYVAGEETAVVRAVGGGPALPTAKPPRPWQSGLNGAPTLVSNVETLARLELAVRVGPAAYRAHGTPEEPGTLLATVSGAGRPAELYEVPYGLALRDVARAHLGSVTRVTGVLAGGFAGGLLPGSALDLPLTHTAFAAAGSALGCGAFTLLTEECPVRVAASVAGFFDRANAGQCGVCVKGTASVAETLAALSRGTAEAADVARLERRGAALTGRGNCATPDAAAVLVASLLRHHRGLLETHIDRPCTRCAAVRFEPDLSLED